MMDKSDLEGYIAGLLSMPAHEGRARIVRIALDRVNKRGLPGDKVTDLPDLVYSYVTNPLVVSLPHLKLLESGGFMKYESGNNTFKCSRFLSGEHISAAYVLFKLADRTSAVFRASHLSDDAMSTHQAGRGLRTLCKDGIIRISSECSSSILYEIKKDYLPELALIPHETFKEFAEECLNNFAKAN